MKLLCESMIPGILVKTVSAKENGAMQRFFSEP